jgi:hypothetical protein
MDNSPSPFQLLVKSYTNNLISRKEYLKDRSQLLKKLQSTGNIEDVDYKNFTLISQGSNAKPFTKKSYSVADWIIIALGFTASAVLGFILYG